MGTIVDTSKKMYIITWHDTLMLPKYNLVGEM